MSTSEENKGCFKMRIIEYHDIKTLLGPCFVSFSIPLLIPGVVLTVVGSYGNENLFPTFGAWHVTGIVILAISVLMLISGIILKCCYRPIISADIEEHLSPTSSMITGSKNLGYEDEIYSSKGLQNSNRVGHHDLKNSHTVVSTHEEKHKKTKEKKNQFLANAAIAENQSRGKPEAARSSLNAQQAHDAQSAQSSNKTQPPPSYERIQEYSNRKKVKDNVTDANVVETTQGNVTTKVTTTIRAEVETAQASGSRDNSIDANENSKFLPGKKKKKRKKRKRNESSESTDVTDGDTTSRRELPELRMRPVLIHEGSPHHHDLHVHFQNGSEESKESKDFKNEEETTENI